MKRIIAVITGLTITSCYPMQQQNAFEQRRIALFTLYKVPYCNQELNSQVRIYKNLVAYIHNDELTGITALLKRYNANYDIEVQNQATSVVTVAQTRIHEFASLNQALRDNRWRPPLRTENDFQQRREKTFRILETIYRHRDTGLHQAIQNNDSIVKKYLKCGARIDWKDGAGKHAFNYLADLELKIAKNPHDRAAAEKFKHLKNLLTGRRNQVLFWAIHHANVDLVIKMIGLGASPFSYFTVSGKIRTALDLAKSLANSIHAVSDHQRLLIYDFLMSLPKKSPTATFENETKNSPSTAMAHLSPIHAPIIVPIASLAIGLLFLEENEDPAKDCTDQTKATIERTEVPRSMVVMNSSIDVTQLTTTEDESAVDQLLREAVSVRIMQKPEAFKYYAPLQEPS